MERKPFPSETQERFIVRFPDGMRDRIADAAKTNNRSMNAEIVARLQASFGAPTQSTADEDLWGRVAELERKRSDLQFQSAHLQREALQIAEQLADAVGEAGNEAMAQKLRWKRSENYHARYEIDDQLAAIGRTLADLYEQASGDAPGTSGRPRVVKIERSE